MMIFTGWRELSLSPGRALKIGLKGMRDRVRLEPLLHEVFGCCIQCFQGGGPVRVVREGLALVVRIEYENELDSIPVHAVLLIFHSMNASGLAPSKYLFRPLCSARHHKYRQETWSFWLGLGPGMPSRRGAGTRHRPCVWRMT